MAPVCLKHSNNFIQNFSYSWRKYVSSLRETVISRSINCISFIAGHRDFSRELLRKTPKEVAGFISDRLETLQHATQTKVVFGGVPVLGTKRKRDFIKEVHMALWSKVDALREFNITFFPCIEPGRGWGRSAFYHNEGMYTEDWQAMSLYFLGQLTALSVHNLWTPCSHIEAEYHDWKWLREMGRLRLKMVEKMVLELQAEMSLQEEGRKKTGSFFCWSWFFWGQLLLCIFQCLKNYETIIVLVSLSWIFLLVFIL